MRASKDDWDRKDKRIETLEGCFKELAAMIRQGDFVTANPKECSRWTMPITYGFLNKLEARAGTME